MAAAVITLMPAVVIIIMMAQEIITMIVAHAYKSAELRTISTPWESRDAGVAREWAALKID